MWSKNRIFGSLRRQTAAIVVAGLMLSNLIGYLLYSYDRQESLRLADAFDLVERAAGVSRLVRDLPEKWEEDVVPASDSRAFRVWASEAPQFASGDVSEDEQQLAAYFRTLTPRIAGNMLHVWFRPSVPDGLSIPSRPDFENAAASRQDPSRIYLIISIDHGNGRWLNFLSHVAPASASLPTLLALNLLLASVGLGVVALWLVARVTSPLFQMTQAASQLGKNLRAKPLSETGPEEVAIAARAFNLMQRRLIRHIEGRTTLLSAISHDLRTPITQMRLRAELMPRSEEREKMLLALDEMNTTIGTFLDYSRTATDTEPSSRIDLGSLVASICDDLADAGQNVSCHIESEVLLNCKRVAIKRVVVNIVENALQYAGAATVRLTRNGSDAVICVEDDGPGIPEERLTDVFQPFFRMESSRVDRREGTGLGLSIALMIVEDHGGTIALRNRDEGGIIAEVRLPTTV